MASGGLSTIPWLEERIAIQLHLGNSFLKDKAAKKAQGVKLEPGWKVIFEDNGSCLEITDSIHYKHNSNLRIVQRYPLTLTDGNVYIEASYPELHTRYPQANVGAVIAAREYRIRATTYGPPRGKLHLVIESIDWQGQGVGGDITRLKHISSCEKVARALRELHHTRTQVDRQCFGQESADAEEELHDMAEDSPNTQMPYGTQFVRPLQPDSRDDVQDVGTRGANPMLAENVRRVELRTNINSMDAAKKAALLSLLNPQRNINGTLGQPKAPSTGGFARHGPSERNTDALPSPSPRRTPNKMSEEHNVRYPEPIVSQLEPPKSRQDDGDGLGLKDRPAQKSPVDVELLDETNVAGEDVSDKPLYVHRDEELAVGEDEENVSSVPDWMAGLQLTRKFTKPTPDQKSLLLKHECWQKPPAGSRFPDANIPIRILIALNDRAARAEAEVEVGATVSDEDDEPPISTAVNSNDRSKNMDTRHSHGQLELLPLPRGDDAEENLSGSETSWSRSSTPELPRHPRVKDQGLPPDSSLNNGKDTADRDFRYQHISHQQRAQIPTGEALIDETHAGPASSPPVATANDHSDEDMELEIAMPCGLGEDTLGVGNKSQLSPPVVRAVQVKETPNAKDKNALVSRPSSPKATQAQTSSGTSKDTSSSSVIYCTYMEPNPSGGGEGAGRAQLPVTGNEAPEQEASSKPGSLRSLSFQAPTNVQDHARKTNDTLMPDVGPELAVLDVQICNSGLAHPEPTPISAQMAPKELSLSDGKVLRHEGKLEESLPPQVEPDAENPTKAHMKRKLNDSPMKKSGRGAKRREIKLVDFGDGESPAKDTAAAIRQARKESMEAFVEERRAGPSSHPLHSAPEVAVELNVPSGAKERPSLEYITPSGEEIQRIHVVTQPPSCIRSRDNQSDSQRVEPLDHGIVMGGPGLEGRSHLPLQKAKSTDLTTGKLSRPNIHQDEQLAEMDIDEPFARPADPEEGIREVPPYPTEVQQAAAETPHHPSPPVRNTPEQSVETTTVYQRFRAAYPEYQGDQKHFIGQCKQMYRLEMEDKMVPKWQWDDYIIRNKTDYKDYCMQCMDNGEDPEPYHRFYKDQVRETIYKKGVIASGQTLLAALEELGIPALAVECAESLTSPAPSVMAESAWKPARKSLPWVPSQPAMGCDHRSSATRPPRRSLPAASRNAVSASARPPASTAHASLHKLAAPSAAWNPRLSTLGSLLRSQAEEDRASSRASTVPASRATPNANGDTYRDFLYAHQRIACFTGDKEVDAQNEWPHNLAVRRRVDVPSEHIDVLDWTDVL